MESQQVVLRHNKDYAMRLSPSARPDSGEVLPPTATATMTEAVRLKEDERQADHLCQCGHRQRERASRLLDVPTGSW